MKKSCFILLFLVTSLPVFAGDVADSALQGQTAALDEPSNLTLSNFFTEGWDDAYDKRVTPGGAPDMALLHVTTNFLEREFRTDYYSQENTASDGTRNIQFMDGLIAYGLNRRFMVEALTDYEWKNARNGGMDTSGAGRAFVARVQLVDVPGASYAFNFRVTTPNDGIKVKQTTLSPALAGWQDLTGIGLKRMAVYYSIQEDAYAGPAEPGSKHNDLAYDVSLAKTWTDPKTPFFGNFTTFAEFYATTVLDGSDQTTTINATPGIRFTLGHGNVLMAGVDLPLSHPHDFDATYRLTYILNF
jgi:hypothetical protein